jgi:cyclase
LAAASARWILSGADKISINTAGVENPDLFAGAADEFGAQAVVAAIDAKQVEPGRWEVFTYGGRRATGIDVLDYARLATERGAGEILLTSMDRDGAKNGYDTALLRAVSAAVTVPVIASGGAGELGHLVDAVKYGGADAVLAASIFPFGEISIGEAKAAMGAAGLPVRL